MSDQTPESTVFPKSLPVMAVLGLSAASASSDWERLRGLQYSSLAKVTVVRIIAHVIAALAVVGIYFGDVHIAALIGWFAALCGSLYYGATIDKALIDVDRRRISRDEVNKQTLSAVFNAMVWVVPLAAFLPFGDSTKALELWAVVGVLMAAAAVMLPAVPLANLIFAGIVGVGSLASFAVSGNYVRCV